MSESNVKSVPINFVVNTVLCLLQNLMELTLPKRKSRLWAYCPNICIYYVIGAVEIGTIAEAETDDEEDEEVNEGEVIYHIINFS